MPDDAVDAVLGWGVGQGHHPLPQVIVALLRSPRAGPGAEEPLIAGEAGDHRRRPPARRGTIRRIRNRQPRPVGEVLAQRPRTVDARARLRLAPAELLDGRARPPGICGTVGRSPPVAHAAAGIEKPAAL